jgi:phosphatidylserine synthase
MLSQLLDQERQLSSNIPHPFSLVSCIFVQSSLVSILFIFTSRLDLLMISMIKFHAMKKTNAAYLVEETTITRPLKEAKT